MILLPKLAIKYLQRKGNSNINIVDQLPGYIGWKDVNSRYLGCNANLAAILKLKDKREIEGLSEKEVISYTEESSQFHHENDKKVLKGKTLSCLHKSDYPYDGDFFYFVKKPIFNDNIITGIIFHCNVFVKSAFLLNLAGIDKKYSQKINHYNIDIYDNPFELSVREIECLFFILRGKTAKETAEMMALSKRTVEFYIENIKNKLGCNTKAELIAKATLHGYMTIIPTRILHSNTTDIFY